MFSYEDIIGKLYYMEYRDALDNTHRITGYIENFNPSGSIALHGINGLVMVKAHMVQLFRPLTKGEIANYNKREAELLEAQEVEE